MDHNERDRKIAALTAIVQTMMPELFCDAPHNTPAPFEKAVSDDDPLALAISETLTPDEIAHAFAWVNASLRSRDEELVPVVRCLSAEQQVRVRVMRLASDAADEAFIAALGPRDAPRRDPDRALEVATRRFIEAMTNDALTHREDVREIVPAAAIVERIAALPEPWRTYTRRELEILKDQIANTLERDRTPTQ